MFLKQFRTATIEIVLMTILTGILYPLAITGLAQLLFRGKANGSMILKNGKVVGSELIGQPFSDAKYFWGRLSASSPSPYNGGASTGSNYGQLNPAFLDGVKKRAHSLKTADSLNHQLIPVDLVTASSSGLDPHISTAAALYQVSRVARACSISEEHVRSILNQNTEGRQFGFLGEARVNVLKLNLALDEIQSISERK